MYSDGDRNMFRQWCSGGAGWNITEINTPTRGWVSVTNPAAVLWALRQKLTLSYVSASRKVCVAIINPI